MLWICIQGAGRRRFLFTRATQISVGNGADDDLLVNDPQLAPGLLHIRTVDLAKKPVWIKTERFRMAICSSRALLQFGSRWIVAVGIVLIITGIAAVRICKDRPMGRVTLPAAGRLAMQLDPQHSVEIEIPPSQNSQMLSFYLRRAAAHPQITIAGKRLKNLGWQGKRYFLLPLHTTPIRIEGHGLVEFERLQLEKPPELEVCAALQKPQSWADYDLLNRCNAAQPSPESSATLAQWRRDIQRRYAELLFQYQRAVHLQQHESAKAVVGMMRRLIADPWDPRALHSRS